MKHIKFAFIAFVYLSSCKQIEKKSSEEVMKIGAIRLLVPSSAKVFKADGIDSDVSGLVSDRNDTFKIEYGNPKFINDVFDQPPLAYPLKEREIFIKNFGSLPPANEVVFSDEAEKDNLQNIYQREYFLYDTINGIQVKLIHPKKIGKGKTGIFIPKLKDGNGFSMYGTNLDSVGNELALKIFHSISYQ